MADTEGGESTPWIQAGLFPSGKLGPMGSLSFSRKVYP